MGTLETWRENFQKLTQSRAGDHFDFAFSHFTGNNSLFKDEAWYNSDNVIMRNVERKCKLGYWQELDGDEVRDNYDFIWFLDSDLSFKYFDWDLFRSFLIKYNPVTAQPAIVPRSKGDRQSDYWFLGMQSELKQSEVVLVRTTSITEVMAAIINAKMWPTIHARILDHDASGAWGTDGFWSRFARLSALHCEGSRGIGSLTIDASPLIHLDTRSMDKTRTESPEKKTNEDGPVCHRACVGHNCDPLTQDDIQRGREGLEAMYSSSCRPFPENDIKSGLMEKYEPPLSSVFITRTYEFEES